MAAAPYLLIAAGGTGGHMFPAQALAEALVRKGWRVALSTDARGARYAGGFPHVVTVEQVASATFARGGLLAKLATPFRILGGIAAANWRMLRVRSPDGQSHHSPATAAAPRATITPTRTARTSGVGPTRRSSTSWTCECAPPTDQSMPLSRRPTACSVSRVACRSARACRLS